jgi:Abnormal spindle-like microcephaly-assoc'd, ASPM-SPD-2-Hydin
MSLGTVERGRLNRQNPCDENFPGGNILSVRGKRCAAHANSRNEGSRAATAVLALLFPLILSASGCVGLANTPGAAISLVPSSVNFGHVAVGSTVSQSITVWNEGQSSLTVTKVDTTAEGARIAGISLPLVLAAGKRSTFEIVYSPKRVGILSGSVSVTSGASGTPGKVTLSGTGVGATSFLTASATNVHFGDVSVGETKTSNVTLTNSGNSDVTVSEVSLSGTRFYTSGISAGLILGPGQSATLDTTFAPAAAGSAAGRVSIVSNAADSPETISLAGIGTYDGSHSVILTWIPSASAVAGYIIYRSQVSGGPYARLNYGILRAHTYTDSTVQPGFTYYYVVRSGTETGVESANSMQISVTIPSP